MIRRVLIDAMGVVALFGFLIAGLWLPELLGVAL